MRVPQPGGFQRRRARRRLQTVIQEGVIKMTKQRYLQNKSMALPYGVQPIGQVATLPTAPPALPAQQHAPKTTRPPSKAFPGSRK